MSSFKLNRRRWLAAGAAGSFVITTRIAAAAHIQPFDFIIVTDTHLGRKDSKAAEKNWRTAIGEINDQPGRFVLHLGDVVDSGREAQYPLYAETRKLLRKPIHEIPGNHDPLELFQKHVTKTTDRVVDHEGVRFILFNNAHRDSHDGFITTEQNKWIAAQCAEAAAKKMQIIFCCHVPIHANKHPDRGWFVKPQAGQTEFYATLTRHADRVLACLHGHFHNGIRGWRDHEHAVEVLCPSVCYNQKRGLKEHIAARRAEGFFVDELRPGYVLAKLGSGKLTLRYKPLGVQSTGQYSAEWEHLQPLENEE